MLVSGKIKKSFGVSECQFKCFSPGKLHALRQVSTARGAPHPPHPHPPQGREKGGDRKGSARTRVCFTSPGVTSGPARRPSASPQPHGSSSEGAKAQISAHSTSASLSHPKKKDAPVSPLQPAGQGTGNAWLLLFLFGSWVLFRVSIYF